MKPPNYYHKHFRPLLAKNLRNSLAQRISEQFPRMGGDRIVGACADLVLEVVWAHLRPVEHLAPGQVLWLAIDKDDPPRRYRKTEQTRLVPVILTLSAPEDVEARIARKKPSERNLNKALRMSREAYEQGGLLSNCDLAELLSTNDARMGQLIAAHERTTNQTVPRRATLHDVGSGLTHKGIICRKRYLEGKEPDQIARETSHSLEAVDYYLGQFDRVRACLKLGMTPHQAAHILQCSPALVDQYVKIHQELEDTGHA
ncbi:MAG: DUF1670 domain-containing protein [Chloroflexi bacterium]|nr:DUF1670 domain-containing protein [Chloroflexota bacterium]